jgi:SAM-dependent methyltransferase/mannose-6-phosphate isomerase-like protein (cupin superfamily)
VLLKGGHIVPQKSNIRRYVHTLPSYVSFTGKGLLGYTFGPLNQQDLEIYYIEVEKGHDLFMVSRKITRTYYVVDGGGYFTIDGREYHVGPGMVVEVPPKVEYCYSGKMTLLALSIPRWSSGNDTFTKWNPDVVGSDCAWMGNGTPWLTRFVRLTVLGRSPIGTFLRLNQRLWNRIPTSITNFGPIRMYGNFLHSLARIYEVRGQAFSTYFLRNRPQLELIRRLLDKKGKGDTLRIAVLGCSTGAEAYSIAWRIRSMRPDLKLSMHAVDISTRAVEFAKRGIYSLTASQLARSEIISRMTASEVEGMFDRSGDVVAVKSWVREGIYWHVADVGEPAILETLEPQDIVVANNFLCHMEDAEAERCLRNVARLVSPNGYLLVSGIDLDLRTRVACDLGWKPVQDLLVEIHEGDGCLRPLWPCHYAALEPLDKKRSDWKTRYAAAFQIAPLMTSPSVTYEREPANA